MAQVRYRVHVGDDYVAVLAPEDTTDKPTALFGELEPAAKFVRAMNWHPRLIQMLRDLTDAAPAFRSKPVGAPGSTARLQQQRHIEIEDRVRDLLSTVAQ